MALTDPEVRVLASLIEKEATVPDSYPLTLGALRLACNQSTNRRPVVSYDDRTVENALMSLKSIGLVRFVHPSHGGRTIRYRQVADERWKMSLGSVRVLAALALRGPQTVNEVRARAERQLPDDEVATIEALLDGLAARSPEPLALRLGRQPAEREERWGAAIGDVPIEWPTSEPWPDDSPTVTLARPVIAPDLPAPAPPSPLPPPDDADAGGAEIRQLNERIDELTAMIDALAARLATVEHVIAD